MHLWKHGSTTTKGVYASFARPYASWSRQPHEFTVSVNLPYFDLVLQRLEESDPEFEIAFGRHVHWGYWADPSRAVQTAEDYALAAEALSQQVYSAANVADGQQILDVGCGFGGTIASLNENFCDLNLVGVNIDERQLERARLKVAAQNGNRIEFSEQRFNMIAKLRFNQRFDDIWIIGRRIRA